MPKVNTVQREQIVNLSTAILMARVDLHQAYARDIDEKTRRKFIKKAYDRLTFAPTTLLVTLQSDIPRPVLLKKKLAATRPKAVRR